MRAAIYSAFLYTITMNPTLNTVPEMNLPPPIAPDNPVNPNMGSNVGSPEAFNARPSNVMPQASPFPAQALPLPQAPLPTIATSAVTSTTTNGALSVASDADLIEKEWVVKAKEIINKTQSDPHEQSKEITIFKADYMKKRYNKTLKLSE